MSQFKTANTLSALLTLEARVCQARCVLQRTSDRDPAFERRVRQLVLLVEKRDRILSTFGRACLAAW